jgi:DNA-binding XRE family transcriptional regulator
VKGFTQEEMAKRLGVHINTYINWEKKTGNISISKAKEIASILEVNICNIFFN